MTTTQEQIANLSTLITDLEADRYPKGSQRLIANEVGRDGTTEHPEQEFEFCCLGCMSWQLGARFVMEAEARLSLTRDDKEILFDKGYPPVFIGEKFGLYARAYDEDTAGAYVDKISTHITSEDGTHELQQEQTPKAYGVLASLNDTSSHFTTYVVPELLVTLGVLEVRDAYDRVNALYPE